MTRDAVTERGIRAGVRRLFRLPLRTADIARADADAELDSFLEARIESLVRRGMTPAEAREEALRRLGGPLSEVRTSLRHSAERREGRMRFRDMVDDVLQDVRYAARGLARRRGFTAAAVLCLAIGIGANATMFGVVDTLLLRPPAGVRDPGHLLWISGKRTTEMGFAEFPGVSYPDYVDFSRSPVLAGAAGYSVNERSFGRGADARQINALTITHNFMHLLGVQPALGRFFTPDETQAGGPPVVILGYAFWQGQFAGAADIIGKAVRVDTKAYTVIGVAPRDFNGVERTRVDVYLPPTAGAFDQDLIPARDLLSSRGAVWLTVLARLRPGVRRERLSAELNAIYHNADAGNKGRAAITIVVASPTATIAMHDPQQVQNATVSLWLACVAGIVLLIACANVASLLLTRAVRRRREIAVRLALGIGRGRLVRMLMTESLVLAGVGAGAGLLVARWGGSILRAALLSDIAVGASILDPRVLAVTAAATLFTGLACGLAPALQATRPDLTTALKAGDREGPEERGRMLNALLIGQVALTLVLLVGAGLFVRSLRNLRALDLGFDAQHVLRARASLDALGYTPAQSEQFFHQLLDRVRAVPGVERAALATGGPFGNELLGGVSIPGHAREAGLPPQRSAVTPDFFATLGMSFRSGRPFTDADRAGGERVAIVNEEMARHYWPSGDAMGQCIKIAGAGMRARASPQTMPCTTVVGVVHTARQGNLVEQPIQNERPMMAFYVPLDQQDSASTNAAFDFGPMLYVRTAGDAARIVPIVRRTMQAMEPDLPFADVTAFSTAIAPQFRPWRIGVTMFGIFGAVALLLAIVGLYGVLAFRVSQRTHEIGVRIALGAERDDVRRLVVGQGLRLGALGVAIGLGAALAAGQVLAALLFGVSARDPLVLATAGGALLVVAVLASYLPARRATRIDPIEALREL